MLLMQQEEYFLLFCLKKRKFQPLALIHPTIYLKETAIKEALRRAETIFKLANEWIFNEYILKKSGNYTQLKENSELQYETEYVLHGKPSDIENLKSTVLQLLLLRETANYIYLCSNPGKSGEAEALAVAIALAAYSPTTNSLDVRIFFS